MAGRRWPAQPGGASRRARAAAGPAHPRAGRGNGNDDPDLRPRRGGVPGRALQRLAPGPQGQQRPAEPHPAGDHQGHPRRLSRGRRRHSRDQLLQFHGGLARRLWDGEHGLRAQPRGRAAGSGRRQRVREPWARPALRGGGAGPHQPDGVALARRQRPRLPQHRVRRPRSDLRRGGAGPSRRRGRHPARGDHLRHAERQGGHLRGGETLRGARSPGTGDDLGHHHRRQRTDPLRTDHRGILEFGVTRPPAEHRAQLRARRQGASSVRTGALPRRADVREHPSQRRSAERIRSLRRESGVHGGDASGVRGIRTGEPGRRVLRDHAPAHPGDRRRGKGPPTPVGAADRAVDPPQRTRAARDRTGKHFRQRRRAHQRDRLAQVRAADPGRRLRRSGGDRAAAGGERRADDRHQHGRGDARLPPGHGEVRAADRRPSPTSAGCRWCSTRRSGP